MTVREIFRAIIDPTPMTIEQAGMILFIMGLSIIVFAFLRGVGVLP